MLWLTPRLVEGLTVYPDSADPALWYYLPERPRLNWQAPSAPLQISKYAGLKEQGGTVTVTVDTGVDEDRLAAIRKQLGAAQLQPPPWVAGQVEIACLKQRYPAQPAPAIGDNSSVFSFSLTPTEIPLLEQPLLAGEPLPLLALYTLDYLALRPVFRLRIEAEWTKVQRYLEEHIGFDLIVFKLDIANIVQDLIEQRLVTIHMDSFVPESEATQERDRALTELQDMVLSTFFAPRINSHIPTEGLDNETGFGCRRLETTQIEQRFLNLTVSEETAVQRRVFPQALLDGPREWTPDSRRTLIQLIDLDHPFYRVRRLVIACNADFVRDAILSVQVVLRYGDASEEAVFLSPGNKEVRWNSLIQDGRTRREVGFRYLVNFRVNPGEERPAQLSSPLSTTELDYLEITPRQLYAIYRVPLLASRVFPWQRYPTITVKTQYRDAAQAVSLQQLFVMTQATPEQYWEVFALTRESIRFQYQVTYQAVDGYPSITGAWQETEAQILISDPLPQQRNLEVVSLIDWSGINGVDVELAYEDSANAIKVGRILSFTSVARANQAFQYSVKDPHRVAISYDVIVNYKNDTVRRVPTSITQAKRLFLRADMPAHQIVTLSAANIDFTGLQLAAVEIECVHAEATTGASSSQKFRFDSSDDTALFEFDFYRRNEYRYTCLYRYTSGAWASITATETTRQLLLSGYPASSLLARSVQIIPQDIDWSRLLRIELKLRYVHGDGQQDAQSFTFSAKQTEVQQWNFICDTEDQAAYAWQLVVSLRNRDIGKLLLPGPKKDAWAATTAESFVIAAYLPKPG